MHRDKFIPVELALVVVYLIVTTSE